MLAAACEAFDDCEYIAALVFTLLHLSIALQGVEPAPDKCFSIPQALRELYV